jgi:hypothetical protein
MTMRSGRLKSSIAAPSRRNSGLETTAKSASGLPRDDPLDLVAGADRHGRLGDDDGEALDQLAAMVARRLIDIGEVGMAVATARRRADRDEDDLGAATASASSVVKESRPARTLLATSASRPGSKIGISPRLSAAILLGVLVDAGHLMAEIGKQAPETRPT